MITLQDHRVKWALSKAAEKYVAFAERPLHYGDQASGTKTAKHEIREERRGKKGLTVMMNPALPSWASVYERRSHDGAIISASGSG